MLKRGRKFDESKGLTLKDELLLEKVSSENSSSYRLFLIISS